MSKRKLSRIQHFNLSAFHQIPDVEQRLNRSATPVSRLRDAEMLCGLLLRYEREYQRLKQQPLQDRQRWTPEQRRDVQTMCEWGTRVTRICFATLHAVLQFPSQQAHDPEQARTLLDAVSRTYHSGTIQPDTVHHLEDLRTLFHPKKKPRAPLPPVVKAKKTQTPKPRPQLSERTARARKKGADALDKAQLLEIQRCGLLTPEERKRLQQLIHAQMKPAKKARSVWEIGARYRRF